MPFTDWAHNAHSLTVHRMHIMCPVCKGYKPIPLVQHHVRCWALVPKRMGNTKGHLQRLPR